MCIFCFGLLILASVKFYRIRLLCRHATENKPVQLQRFNQHERLKKKDLCSFVVVGFFSHVFSPLLANGETFLMNSAASEEDESV